MYCNVCSQQGSIYQAYIPRLKLYVYVCDECNTVWTEEECKQIGSERISLYGDLETFLEKHNVGYLKAEIKKIGYDWDKSILKNDSIVFCSICETKGIIYKTYIGALGINVYYCDTCNSMWKNPQQIDAKSQETLLSFLKTNGLNYGNAYFSSSELEWKK
jgi:hypothetical protein